MIVLAIVVVVFLPKQYQGETGIDIRLSRKDVFDKAQDLKRWHTAAMLGGVSFDSMEIPRDIHSQIPVPGVNIDSLFAEVKDAAQSLKMKVKPLRTEFPSRIMYEVEGGPLHGMNPEILLFELDGQNTKVTIRESFEFRGLMGGIKAFSVRLAMNKLNAASLENLKKICEQGR